MKTEQRYYGSSTRETVATSYYIPASLKSVTVTDGGGKGGGGQEWSDPVL